jgi:hypothetical protein
MKNIPGYENAKIKKNEYQFKLSNGEGPHEEQKMSAPAWLQYRNQRPSVKQHIQDYADQHHMTKSLQADCNAVLHMQQIRPKSVTRFS